MYVDWLNGISNATISLLQCNPVVGSVERMLEEFARVKRSNRAHFISITSGQLGYTNKYFFCALSQISMGRPVFIPETFIPYVHTILLQQAGGRYRYDTILQALGLWGGSLATHVSLHELKYTLLRPVLNKQVHATPVPAVACKYCKTIFSGGKTLAERFRVHPCKYLPPNVVRKVNLHVIPLHHADFVEYRQNIRDKRTEDQERLIRLVFDVRANVIVIGEAGCGKTTCVLDVIETIAETAGIDSMIRVAMNKQNAEAIGGRTVNSQFCFGTMDLHSVYKYIHMRGEERLEAVRSFVRTTMKAERFDEIHKATYFFLEEFGQVPLEIGEFVDLASLHHFPLALHWLRGHQGRPRCVGYPWPRWSSSSSATATAIACTCP